MAETKALCDADAPAGTRVATFVADVSDESALQAFAAAVAAEHQTDHINLLFNNAGIGGGGSFVLDERDEWDRTFGICWGGVYLGTRTFMPMLLASSEGHIVNTSSVNGFWASLGRGIPHTAYSAAKFAVKGFTEALLTDFRLNAPHLRGSVVMPGHIGTSIVHQLRQGARARAEGADRGAGRRAARAAGTWRDRRRGSERRGHPPRHADARRDVPRQRSDQCRRGGDDHPRRCARQRVAHPRRRRRPSHSTSWCARCRRRHTTNRSPRSWLLATSSVSGSDGVAMLYGDLVAASQRTAATSKRSEKVAALADLLRATPPDEIAAAIGLLIGDPRQGRLGVGWATVSSLQVEPAPESSLSIHEVDEVLTRLTTIGGSGSQGERFRVMTDLWSRATAAEQNHLHRVLTGELRQGANEGVVADAVGKAGGQPIAAVRRAAMLLGDLGSAAYLALTGQSLDVGLTPLTAVQPMLAGTSASVTDALAEIGLASVEWKLDGIRVQAHKRGNEVRLFSRGLNDITGGVAGCGRARSRCDRSLSFSTARHWGSTRTASRGSSKKP